MSPLHSIFNFDADWFDFRNLVCFISEKQPKNISSQKMMSHSVGLELILKENLKVKECLNLLTNGFTCMLGGMVPLSCGHRLLLKR